MRLFSYRNRARFLKAGLIVLLVLAVLLVLSAAALAYLDRYIVYDQQGAHLDVNWRENNRDYTVLTPSVDADITYLDENSAAIGSIQPLTGFYVTSDMLQDLDGLEQALSGASAVLFDMKQDDGTQYLSADGSDEITSSVDTAALIQLIETLSDRDVYLIARIPAFVDQTYCTEHPECGLFRSDGTLWADENGNAWLDPAHSDTITHLESTCAALRQLGFDEVVLDRFQFPDDAEIVYDETQRTREDIISNAARTLQRNLEAQNLTVSFGASAETAFPYRLTIGRLYFHADPASMTATQTESVTNPASQLVFLTASPSAVEGYSTLSPAPVSSSE